MAADTPSLRGQQPWKAAYEKDYEWLGDVVTKHYHGDDSDVKVLIVGMLKAFEGMPVEDYSASAAAFLGRAHHPTLKRRLRDCGYAPMVELLRYLESHGFTNYIASGGDRDFMRPITQELYGIAPDLTTLGKIVGGGMPVGAFGGRREIMEKLAPLGPVYQAGTLSGNPVAMAAGLATLEAVAQPGFHARLAAATGRLAAGLAEAARDARLPAAVNHVCGMFSLFFSEGPVTNYRQVMASDAARFRRFFHAMLAAGVYLAPSPYEAGFVSAAHGEAEISATVEAARRAFESIARDG